MRNIFYLLLVMLMLHACSSDKSAELSQSEINGLEAQAKQDFQSTYELLKQYDSEEGFKIELFEREVFYKTFLKLKDVNKDLTRESVLEKLSENQKKWLNTVDKYLENNDISIVTAYRNTLVSGKIENPDETKDIIATTYFMEACSKNIRQLDFITKVHRVKGRNISEECAIAFANLSINGAKLAKEVKAGDPFLIALYSGLVAYYTKKVKDKCPDELKLELSYEERMAECLGRYGGNVCAWNCDQTPPCNCPADKICNSRPGCSWSYTQNKCNCESDCTAAQQAYCRELNCRGCVNGTCTLCE